MSEKLSIAFVVVDDRFHSPDALPRFGAAPSAVLHGFSTYPDDVEISIISCTHQTRDETIQLAPNILFHGISVPKSGYLRSLHAGCLLAVTRKIRQIHPHIVHAQGTERWCALSTAFLPQPKVLTIHGNLEALDPVFRPRPRAYWKLQTSLQKFTIPRFDGVFCNSSYTENAMAGRAKKTWRVENPLNPQYFSQPMDSLQSSEMLPLLLNIGVFQPWKRQREILQILGQLHAEGIRFKVRFIGAFSGGTYENVCRALLDKGIQDGYAEYLSPMPPELLIRQMDQAQGMIHFPSEESFGLVVAEALTRGLTLFTCKTGGIRDIVNNVPGCYLSEPDDFSDLHYSLRNWIACGAPRNPAGMSAMHARYTPEAIAGKHIEIYRSLL